MTISVSWEQAKSTFDDLPEKVKNGDEIIIMDGTYPIARIASPITTDDSIVGMWQDKFSSEVLPEDIQHVWRISAGR